MNRKKVLVTGSNGLLGQKIIYSLIERKDIDLLASSKGLNRLVTKSGYKYIDLDITQNEEVKKVFEKPVKVVKKKRRKKSPCALPAGAFLFFPS